MINTLRERYESWVLRRAQHNSWLPEFADTNSLFIHIPKAAGTSIASAIYGKDPWHYPISDYNYLSRFLSKRLYKFAFVRNPYSRIISSYRYSFVQTERHPTTSVRFVTDYSSFEDFVNSWLTQENISKHYFFHSQAFYLSPARDDLNIDFIGRFEQIEVDFRQVAKQLSLDVELPKLNTTPQKHQTGEITEELAEKIYSVYEEDFLSFNYAEDSYKQL